MLVLSLRLFNPFLKKRLLKAFLLPFIFLKAKPGGITLLRLAKASPSRKKKQEYPRPYFPLEII
jgi:hypothetical protein